LILLAEALPVNGEVPIGVGHTVTGTESMLKVSFAADFLSLRCPSIAYAFMQKLCKCSLVYLRLINLRSNSAEYPIVCYVFGLVASSLHVK
jgi:hypothetical protein